MVCLACLTITAFIHPHLIYYGLFSMQHRGMEAAGICVNDNQGNFSYVKDEGLVTEVLMK